VTIRIGFLFIGGVHHVFHTMPVACALARRAGVKVVAIAADAAIERTIGQVIAAAPDVRIAVERLRRPGLIDLFGRPSWSKIPMLWRNRRRLSDFDVLFTAERTSLALKKMGLRRTRFVTIPHGAGDRAIAIEPRYRLFDRILVAGNKHCRRLVASGVKAERVRQVGYPKAEFLGGIARQAPSLFDNDLPTVLFNPHFRPDLSCLGMAREIVEEVTRADIVNLIVAPHIRVFEDASPHEIAAWEALAVPGRVLVDCGSDRMIDMSYVAAADIYVGDVSSQSYEFLLLGYRPCVFVNAHSVAWEEDPSYLFWHFGEVVTTAAEVPAAIARAPGLHQRFLPRQKAVLEETFATLEGSADRAADAVLELLSEPGSPP
jgi:hypothetical protein